MGRKFRDNRFLQLLLLWLLLLWVVTAIEPFDRRDWLLENLLVFIYAALLLATYRRFAFSNLSYGLFAVFLSLHLVGAHYTYSETPFGFWLQDALDLSRNRACAAAGRTCWSWSPSWGSAASMRPSRALSR